MVYLIYLVCVGPLSLQVQLVFRKIRGGSKRSWNDVNAYKCVFIFTGRVVVKEYFPKIDNQFVSYRKGTCSKLELDYFFRHWLYREMLL